jgi:hypothetical protein
VTRNGTTNQWVLNPNANLANDTRYTVTLTGGTASIRDLAGAPLVTTSWTFTTGPAPTITARTPAVNATAVAVGGNVTVTFSEAVNGVSGTTFRLRNPAGTLIGAVVTRNGTTNQWILNPNANLANDTRYTVTLTGGTASIRDVAGNPLATATWTFLTGPAPAVTARTPGINATAVVRSANVTATFGEAMQAATMTAANATLRLGTATTGTLITSAVSYNATTRVLTVNPGATLAPNTLYTVRLSTGIRDTAGNPLPATTWSFTTGA